MRGREVEEEMERKERAKGEIKNSPLLYNCSLNVYGVRQTDGNPAIVLVF